VAAIHLDLKPIIVRGTGPHRHGDVTEAPVWTQEIIGQGSCLVWPVLGDTGKRVSILRVNVNPFRGVRDLVDVPPFSHVPGERSHITDLYDGLETDILLDAQTEIVDGWRVGLNFDRIDGTRRAQRGPDKVSQIVYIAEIDGQRAIRWRIVDQIPARGAATRARSMVNATHGAKHGLPFAEYVPGKPDTWLPIHGPRFPVPLRSVGVIP